MGPAHAEQAREVLDGGRDVMDKPPRLSGHGAVAQMGERLVRNEEVRGSIPLSSTMYRIRSNPFSYLVA